MRSCTDRLLRFLIDIIWFLFEYSCFVALVGIIVAALSHHQCEWLEFADAFQIFFGTTMTCSVMFLLYGLWDIYKGNELGTSASNFSIIMIFSSFAFYGYMIGMVFEIAQKS